MSLEDMASFADGQQAQNDESQAGTESFNEKSIDAGFVESANPDKVETKYSNDFDQELYDEVLEKFDIKKREKNQDIQDKELQKKNVSENYQKLDKVQNAKQIEKVISQDIGKIQKLVNAGLINSAQGQNLKKLVLKNAFDKLVQAEKNKTKTKSRNVLPNKSQNTNSVLEEFSSNNPDFFKVNGRKNVLDYLKAGNVQVGKDEINKISNIVREVEKAAIDRYLQKVSHEKILRDSNQVAKQRLTANAQKTGFNVNLSRPFTREQIGKMSSAEFTKYEPIIMEQLKKGFIK